MKLPDDILEQYYYFVRFLHNSSPVLDIEQPFYESCAILDIAIKDWETEHGSEHVRIQYFTSDTCSKRILSKKGCDLTKRIILHKDYTFGWIWKSYSRFVTSVRPDCVSLN